MINVGGLGHNIVGLQAPGSKQVLWYEQKFTDNTRKFARFGPVSDVMMRLYTRAGMRADSKSLTTPQYLSANAAVVDQMLLGPKPYNVFTNSCVTNCIPILQSAGYFPPYGIEAPKQLQVWFESWHFSWGN